MSLSALGDGLAGDVSPTLVRLHHQALVDVQTTHLSARSFSAETSLLEAKTYLLTLCLVKLDRKEDKRSKTMSLLGIDIAFAWEVLAGAQFSVRLQQRFVA